MKLSVSGHPAFRPMESDVGLAFTEFGPYERMLLEGRPLNDVLRDVEVNTREAAMALIRAESDVDALLSGDYLTILRVEKVQ